MIIQPAVPATSPAGLTNTAVNPTSNTAYVTVGANGATMANYWVNAVSVATSATAYMMTVPPGGTCALQYSGGTPVWFWSECTPALPASTVAATNTTGRDLSVVFCGGGSVSAISINGVTTNIVQAPAMNSQGIPLPAGASIAVTYTGVVTWSWLDPIDLTLAHSDGVVYAQPNLVAASGAGGYSPLNTLPYAVHNGASAAGFCAGVSNLCPDLHISRQAVFGRLRRCRSRCVQHRPCPLARFGQPSSEHCARGGRRVLACCSIAVDHLTLPGS